jgi:hypothetical protein
LNSYVAQEKVSVIRLTVRIMLKLTVIRIKLFLNRTSTSSQYARLCKGSIKARKSLFYKQDLKCPFI